MLPPTSPEADCRVRIFIPGRELPFTGHPTLGSAHAWFEGGGMPHTDDVVMQECAAGLVRVLRGDGILSFAAPATQRTGESVGQWLIRAGEASTNYRVSQGDRLGRASDISITADDDGQVWVGGATTTCVRGTAVM